VEPLRELLDHVSGAAASSGDRAPSDEALRAAVGAGRFVRGSAAAVKVPREAAQLARELRRKRRRRSGLKHVRALERWRPWTEIAQELERQGFGRFSAEDVAQAVAALPLEAHPEGPRSAQELAQLEAGFRDGWAQEFPGEPWPGLAEARRRIRAKAGFG